MSFDTENRKIKDIFQRPARYNIPRYQREYVWTKTNWDELIKDIEFSLNGHPEQKWSHFLGTIVLSNALSPNRQFAPIEGITDYEVIDGQQRITTIYILIISIYHKMLLTNNTKSKWLYETYLTSQASDSNRYMMINNPDYDKDIKEIIDLGEKGKIPNTNVFNKLYSFIELELSKFDIDKLDAFLNSLLNINIVEIVSNQEEEIYNIFEVLNARGQKLRQIDLLKNHIMKYIQPREQRFIDDAKEKWNLLLKNLTFLNDADDFIRHFAKSYIEKQAENSDSVYRLIKENIDVSTLSSFLEDLHEYSVIYNKVALNVINSNAMIYFNIKSNKQIRPLICSIYFLSSKNIINDIDFKKVVINLRNFFFMYNIYGVTSNRIDSTISSYAYNFYRVNNAKYFKILASKMFLDLSDFLPTSDILQQFKTNQSFRYSNKDRKIKRNGKLVKYLLFEISNEYQTDTLLDESALTIEHLVSDNGNTQNAEVQNLVLTSEEINSIDLSNKSITEKVAILKEKSNIAINKELDKYIDHSSGQFDFLKRSDDLTNLVFTKLFYFDKSLFGIKEADIVEYFAKLDLVKDDVELTKLIIETGISFYKKLSKDPKLVDMLNRYNSMVVY